MKKTILLLTIAISLNVSAQKLWQKIPDDAKHVYAGAAITGITTTITYKLTKRKGLSLCTGWTVGATAGWLKEKVWDQQMGKGVYNLQDFFSTVWGSTIMVPAIFCIRDSRAKRQPIQDTTLYTNLK